MALVAKCTGGKRVNYTKRMSYTSRAHAAAISHSLGPGWHMNVLQKKYGHVGSVTKKLCLRRQHFNNNRKSIKKIRKNNTGSLPDIHYGPDAAQVDISDDEMKTKCDLFLKRLTEQVSTVEKVNEIEKATIGQHENVKWRELRRDFLTASNFGKVLKRRSKTPCHNLVKSLLYKTEINTPSITFGRIHEKTAKIKYIETTGTNVQECGMFICSQYPFLAASPDGLLGDTGVIEIKCFPSITGLFRDASNKNLCYEVRDGKVTLKQNHQYYYQVQGQLNITGRNFCDFVMYATNDFNIERIYKDEELWSNMLPKLIAFYKNCILPEIIDGRIPRGMKVRDLNIC